MTLNKIFYMHIPKTSGTSFNKFIATHYDSGDYTIHLESNTEWLKNGNFNNLMKKSFLSGHVHFPRFLERSASSDYFTFTVFRDPIEQVISHIAWVRHLSEPGNEDILGGLPFAFQNISKKLRSLDLSRPSVLTSYISTMGALETALFENCQTRYLLDVSDNVKIGEKHLHEALENLGKFDLIGLCESFFETIILLCYKMKWKPPQSVHKLNVSKSKFGLDASNTHLRSALRQLIVYDQIVYDEARKVFIGSFFDAARDLQVRSIHPTSLINIDEMAKLLGHEKSKRYRKDLRDFFSRQ